MAQAKKGEPKPEPKGTKGKPKGTKGTKGKPQRPTI